MKTRFWMIIGIVLAAVFVILYSIFTTETAQNPKSLLCGGDFIQQGNGCVLNPKNIEPNTITIYQSSENTGTRLAIAPTTLVINLEENNKITWTNRGIFTVTVSDNEKGLWSLGEIKPSMQDSLNLNNTGFYSYLVVGGPEGETGQIVVLGKNVDSLSIDTRSKMAQAIISENFYEHPELVGVGSGGAPGTGVIITINEKQLKLHKDAISYYYEMYSQMIPFDVPITIEFSGSVVPTG